VDLFYGEEASITAMFLDIRDFTSRSETMEAMDVVSFLNDYFEKCSIVIRDHGGHINKYTGDGFLAIFGAPEPLAQHTLWAFDAACKLWELSIQSILGGKPMEIGIGLHSGKAVLGNIGSETKIEYTAVGDTLNTAARLQEYTKAMKDFPIIMSLATKGQLKDHPGYDQIRNLGLKKIRGKREKLEAYGLKPVPRYALDEAQNCVITPH